MSEHKVATGVCETISERGEWVTFEINVGRQYPVKLATKKSELIELGRAASRNGGRMDWTFNEVESDRINEHSGKPYINRYLEGVAPMGTVEIDGVEVSQSARRVATPDAAPKPGGIRPGGTDGMTKEEWARKDSAIHKMACIKTAAAALTHTLPSDPSGEDLTSFLSRTAILANAWHRVVLAERDDPAGEDVPF